jgi:hypothetical protein
VTVILSDLQGRKMLQKDFAGESVPLILHLTGLSSGMYLVQMKSEGKWFETSKFIVER